VRAGNALAEAGRARKLAGRVNATPDWSLVAGRIRQATAGWDDQVAVRRFEEKGGTLLRGQAHIVGHGEVEVDGRRVWARRGIVIATGGEPSVPPVSGLEEVGYWTNREALEATEAPSSLVVLGAGPVGLELAQAFASFGTWVTLVEAAEHALPAEEPEQGEAMDQVIRGEGMALHTGAVALAARRDRGVIAWSCRTVPPWRGSGCWWRPGGGWTCVGWGWMPPAWTPTRRRWPPTPTSRR
jgi:pyruvate/2-oxoglutarate dehydrogenase complex dihydrolipoamide dehydrogenase (E3) component